MILTAVFALGLLATACQAQQVPDAADTLSLHNKYRAEHGAEPLTWSQRMADSALRHASKCIWEHSTFTERGGAGENMYYSIGYDVRSIGARATQGWYDEVKDYNFGNPGEPRFQGAIIGHFTQMVWAATREMGCALVRCPRMRGAPYANADFLVCHYDPPGNLRVPSEYARNVLPRGTRRQAPAGQQPSVVAAPAAPAPAPAPAGDPWLTAPACKGRASEASATLDRLLRPWGFEGGVSCAFRPGAAGPSQATKPSPSSPAVQTPPAKPAGKPSGGSGSKDPWVQAPLCVGLPISSAARDAQGRPWGWQNGASCAFKGPAARRKQPDNKVVQERVLKSPAPATPSPAPTTQPLPAPLAATSVITTAHNTTRKGTRHSRPRRARGSTGAGDPVFDSAPACEGTPTTTNSIRDARGRAWGLRNGKSCAFKTEAPAAGTTTRQVATESAQRLPQPAAAAAAPPPPPQQQQQQQQLLLPTPTPLLAVQPQLTAAAAPSTAEQQSQAAPPQQVPAAGDWLPRVVG